MIPTTRCETRLLFSGTEEGHGIVDGNGGWWWAQFNKKKDPLPYGRPGSDEVEVFQMQLMQLVKVWKQCNSRTTKLFVIVEIVCLFLMFNSLALCFCSCTFIFTTINQ